MYWIDSKKTETTRKDASRFSIDNAYGNPFFFKVCLNKFKKGNVKLPDHTRVTWTSPFWRLAAVLYHKTSLYGN